MIRSDSSMVNFDFLFIGGRIVFHSDAVNCDGMVRLWHPEHFEIYNCLSDCNSFTEIFMLFDLKDCISSSVGIGIDETHPENMMTSM